MSNDSRQKNIPSSQNIHAEWTKERKKKGLKEIPPINNAAGTSTGNLANSDKSWKSAPDFFKQMIKDKRKNKDNI